MSEKHNRLYQKYPVLKHIFEQSNIAIEKYLIYKLLNENDFLESKNDSCIHFPFILNGALKIQKYNDAGGSIHLYTIFAGDICHESLRCLLNARLDHITATALCETEVCMIPLPIIEKHLLSNPVFLNYIYEDLSKKFTYLIHNKDSIINESLETRLIKLLLSYNSNIIYTTHQKLATELDSAREVVSKKLKELEQKGHVSLTRGKIKLNPSFKTLV